MVIILIILEFIADLQRPLLQRQDHLDALWLTTDVETAGFADTVVLATDWLAAGLGHLGGGLAVVGIYFLRKPWRRLRIFLLILPHRTLHRRRHSIRYHYPFIIAHLARNRVFLTFDRRLRLPPRDVIPLRELTIDGLRLLQGGDAVLRLAADFDQVVEL